MTTCIAAASMKLGAIVLVTDTMLSDDESSVDAAAIKYAVLSRHPHPPWICLYTGSPIVFSTLTDHIRRELATINAGALSGADVIAAAKSAYNSIINQGVASEAAQLRGLNGQQLSDFLANGATSAEVKEWRSATIDAMFNNPTELLLCGFEQLDPHLISVDYRGRCEIRDSYGFHAIGVGATIVNGWLFAHQDFRSADSIDRIATACLRRSTHQKTPGVLVEPHGWVLCVRMVFVIRTCCRAGERMPYGVRGRRDAISRCRQKL